MTRCIYIKIYTLSVGAVKFLLLFSRNPRFYHSYVEGLQRLRTRRDRKWHFQQEHVRFFHSVSITLLHIDLHLSNLDFPNLYLEYTLREV